MAYATIHDLEELLAQDAESYHDYMLLTRDDTSYRVSVETLKDMMTGLWGNERFEMFNKVLTSPSNLIHANTLQYNVIADEDLVRGDIVMIQDNNLNPNEASVKKHDGQGTALGIVKEDVLATEQATIIISGIYDNFDDAHPVNTSMFQKGDILFMGPTGEFTNVKPTAGLEQQVGVIAAVNETHGAIVLNFDGQIEKSRQIEYDRTVSNVSSSNVQDALDEIWSILYTEMYTSPRLLINNDYATLPRIPVGTIVNDMAMVFDDSSTNVCEDYTCSVNGNFLVFDGADYLDGKYAKVSYLTIKI